MHWRCWPAGKLDEVELSSTSSRLPADQHRRCIITHSSAPEDGRNYRPKHVKLIGIINIPLLLHIVGCLYYYINDARSHEHQIRIMFHSVWFASLQPGQPSPLFQFAMSHSPHALVQFSVFTLWLYWPDLKNVLEILFLRLPERLQTKLLLCYVSTFCWFLGVKRAEKKWLETIVR